MTIQKLEAVPGAAQARLAPAPHPWFKHPGAYVEVRHDERVYYIVSDTGTARVEQGEAERYALAALTPEQQVAHDVNTATADRDVRRDPDAALPGLDSQYPTALECLQAHPGCEFEVVAQSVRRQDAAEPGAELTPPIPGWRAIVRLVAGAIGVVLHIATDAYEIVQSRVALSLLDRAARRGVLLYRFAWASIDAVRIRAIGAERATTQTVEGRRVGIRFDLPSVEARAFSGRMQAGGTLVTSHDGSTAIRATACLTFGGVSIFHVDTASWRHSSQVAHRLAQADAALDYLIRAASGLMRDAEGTVNVPDDEAAEVVLRALAPKLYERITEAQYPVHEEWVAAEKEQHERCVKAYKRLQDRASELTSMHKDVYLGGFRFVLAAPHFASNRQVSTNSYYDGLARERMTTALLALARHAGVVNAGMVPEAVS